jgi:hypothetical protein
MLLGVKYCANSATASVNINLIMIIRLEEPNILVTRGAINCVYSLEHVSKPIGAENILH